MLFTGIGILDTPFDTFDQITKIAAAFLRASIAIVSLVDNERLLFKSQRAIDRGQVERARGLNASATFSVGIYHLRGATRMEGGLRLPEQGPVDWLVRATADENKERSEVRRNHGQTSTDRRRKPAGRCWGAAGIHPAYGAVA